MKSDINIEEKRKKRIEKLLNLSYISNSGFLEMDASFQMNVINRSLHTNFDVDYENIPFESWVKLVHVDDRNTIIAKFENLLLTQGGKFECTFRILRKDGKFIWVELLSMTEYDEEKKLMGIIGSLTDITEKKENEDLMYNLAYIDSLTGLYKESKLIEVTKDLIKKKTKCHVLFIFMYNFFLLQDTFGIEYATSALVKFANILRKNFPEGSDIFKMRAQEFVVISYVDISHEALIEMFNSAAVETGIEIYKNIKTFQPYIHTGVSELPIEGLTYDALIDKTRITLRYAKKLEEGTHTFYNSEIENKINRGIYIQTNLLNALAKDELFVKFQPIVNAKTNAVDSYEALLRWADKNHGEIYPDEFISISETTGDIIELGYFVIREVCNFIKRFELKFTTLIKVAINVSVIQLLEEDFAENLIAIIESKNISPESIILELTETVALNKEDIVISQLNILRNAGFGISLDDFGTGYSSLKTLIDIPLTQLKIDKEIVQNVHESNTLNNFVRSMLVMCKEHNIEVVAEGIEEEKYVDSIRSMGFDLIQGYYYAMPEKEETIIKGNNVYPVM